MPSLPKVSVLLPVKNEAVRIESTLEAVMAQTYPRDQMEILVIDGFSSDGTREIIDQMKKRDERIVLLDNPEQYVASGLNIGISKASGDILIRVDGHTKIASDYVSSCVQELIRTGADNVGGRMRAVGGNFFGEAVALATSHPFGIGNARFHYSEREEWVDTVYLGAWNKDVFRRIGLFNEEFVRNQDDEFNYRLRESGGRILLSPKIRSQYIVRGNARALWSQYFQYGFWKVRVLQKHSRQMQLRQFIPLILVLSLAGSLTGWFLFSGCFYLFAGLILLYLTISLFISLRMAMETKWRYFFLLPPIFGILHFGYGFGFLAGLVRFWNRWGEK